MQYAILPNTNLRVSRVSFGTASLHHLFSTEQRQRVLVAAEASGISHFDTSPYYGYGLAESDLGLFMRGRRHAITVTTKVGLFPFGGVACGAVGVWARKAAGKLIPRLSAPEVDWRVKRAAASLNASLRRLKTDYVDFLLLHEPNIDLLNADEFLEWVNAERSSGKLRFAGLAGLPTLLEPWVRADHPLARVLQTKDDLATTAADFVLEQGRPLQFTYGYLSARARDGRNASVPDIVRDALNRNSHGSVLFSTRSAERVRQVASYCE